jgi:hypothetical protein
VGFKSQSHRARNAGRLELESLRKRVCAGVRLIKCSSLVALLSKGNLHRAAGIARSMSLRMSFGMNFTMRLAAICFVDRGLTTCYM